MFRNLLFLLVCVAPASAQSVAPHKFTIYEFIPYTSHVAAGQLTQSPPLPQYLESLNIHRIDVVYENRYFTDGEPDRAKIESVARQALANNTPVSFDNEFGVRQHPDTVIPKTLQILDIYHAVNSVNPVGVYATVPQNTYAYKDDIHKYDALSAQYAPVAAKVDFFSPVLYNYAGSDFKLWVYAANYNIAAARMYKMDKPIYPYISTIVHLKPSGDDDTGMKGAVRPMSEDEMKARLEVLYRLGADGCIVWASSGDKTMDGKQPYFDRLSGWGKALADFAASHK